MSTTGNTRGKAGGLSGGRRVVPSGSAADWFTQIADLAGLRCAYDFRGKPGSSILTADGNGGIYEATDLSAAGNNFVHWRSSGNSEIARLVTDSVGQHLEATGGGDERHFGFNVGSSAGDVDLGTSNGFHIFLAFRVKDAIAQSSGSSGSAASGFGVNAAGTNGRPLCKFADIGGASSAGSWTTIIDGGGGQLSDGDGTPVNIANLAGREDGPAPDQFALIEWRNSALDIEQEVWVNGFRVGFFEAPDKAGGDSMTYMIVGKRDLNLSGKGHKIGAFAVGNPDDFGQEFTKAEAATLRAAMLADFGIEVWDGSTYPS